jgi:D-3-phosphoglycerate dehydrogenase
MLKVAVTDYTFGSLDIEQAILKPLGCELIGQQCKTREELIALTRDADCVLTQFARVDAAVIGAMRQCRVIVRYGIGVDNVDLAAAAARGIPVCNVPGFCSDEVADHTLALMLALTRMLAPTWDAIRGGAWKLPVPLAEMRVLKGMTVGLVAFGRIAREVAARLLAFKARVLAFDPAVDAAAVRDAGCEPVTLGELWAASDIISLHCPSTPATRFLVNKDALGQMKRGVLLVNASRGDLVQTDDLIAALRSGHVAGAALDVCYPEPPPKDSPLLGMPNVIMTPHVASASVGAVETLRRSAAEAVACAVRREKLPNVVNGVVA